MRVGLWMALGAMTLGVVATGGAPKRAEASVLLTRMNANLCVDINQSTGAIGLWACNGGANQNFFGGYGQQRFNGQCLDQANNSGSNMWLVLRACDPNSRTQKWGVSPAGELKNEAGYCLDVPFSNASSGARLQMFACNNGANQKWVMGTLNPPPPTSPIFPKPVPVVPPPAQQRPAPIPGTCAYNRC